ncbi:hypothetical protein PYW07_003249 [Mythimna separata]|uniref:Tyrosine-protein kinase receptor n=1 Tax=Mythimna separata TaxID=271217 RepID=A0AAD8DRN7_MYTSE|nr:hypothetical protein PYW07_003249 [Mythimna separata]
MSAPLNWHKWLVLSLLGLALSARTIGCDYSSITEKFGAEAVVRCNEKCPFQNRTGDGHFDVSCGSDCSVQQCKLGCSLWQEGLENSCQIVCNVTSETVFSRELYCVMGCNEALNTYFQKLRELIGIPTAPALVADSLTATSLSLVWEAPNLGNLSYMVQWRYEELPGTWQYYSNSSHSDQSIIHVDGLRPYTKYRFRVAIFLSGRGGNGEPVYSAPSVVISTLENGKPSSAPSSLRAVAPDPSRVAISWEPGPFPNGPLISYVLRLTDTQPNTNDALEDMPASNYTLFYMFQNLAPAREYEVSVAMRNSVGEGPRAYVRISTPPLPTSVPSQQPILILGGEQNVLAAPANDMLSDPVELYSTEHSITGVGLDISSDSLFTSVSNGYVYRSSLSKKSTSEAILTPENYKPQDLSVDWLNRHLYVLGEVQYRRADWSNVTFITNWEILRCDFDGKNLIVALSGFISRPIHFEVDAYNGYLFWAQQGGDRGGLYRLDLANISNGVRHDGPPEMIVRDAHLGAFTVDHADFRILVAHLRRNTVLAVSLDGREVADFRANTQTPMFLSTRSIAYAGGLFYWTNGKEMLTEEYHEQSDSYFHNEYPLAYNTKTIATRQVLVALRSCQPIPVPVNPPLGLQSVMGIDRAKVSWSPPHLLGHQGSGAWQQWTFHLQLTHVDTGDVIDIMNITESTWIVENLKQGAEYVIRVAAVTESGSGPWSSEFVGKTLASSPNTLHSTLLWSGPDGLLQTDLTGDHLQILIHGADLKNFQITDISWYRDKLYLVTNVSTVMWYNTTTHEKGFMPSMDNVGSLAVDWVGKKIYWSNPKQQLITRGNLDGGNREPVPIVTVAKELTIDSLGAYIYWNTGHAVEAARLNGENKMIYYPAQLFSGKQVMGLTADLEEKWLYWLVRSYDGSELHRAPTADQITHGVSEISGSLVTRLSGTATLGPLCYFSGRLVWVQDASRAVVSDLAGRYTAELVPRVHVIAVRDPTLHAESESLIAIPETINSSSIAVAGEWDKFNVTWAPATRVNVNNSRVYYDVNLHFPGQYKIERTVEESWVEVVSVSVAPYSSMEATVRAHTHWGGGPAARARLHSPQAPPSAPQAPRIYVQPALRYKLLTVEESWVYSSMEATVRAHTHWGGGPAARARLHSPQAPPSAPQAPRIYVQPALRYKLLTVEESWVYSSMEATVRAHTHWGGGPAARARLHSPQAPPSAPQAPRIYVQPALRYKLLTVEESWVYSSMEATVRAHTHWGGGPAARARLHSPQAPPSAPQAPRIYVQPALRYKLLTVEESWVYSSMEATVRAHTHWGGGPAARARLHSPQAPPSAPQAPRIYVQPALRYKLLTVEESWVYSSMEATVRAHTHWGGGPAARARLHSPQAPPSAPQAPRIYVQPALRYKLLTVEESWVYSSMEATVRAHTHWGGGPAARARLHSPQAPPSAPQAPRIYVQPALRYKLLTVEESWVYSSMEATVRAHTHWGGGPAARARLHSPQAPPSAPQAPRIYVQPALRYKLLTVEESWVYSSMEATVRAHTHWGGGPAARARLHSPQAPPSAPQAPRIYVQPALRYKLLTVEESWVYSSMEATVRAHTHWGGGPAARARLHSPQAPPSAPQAPRIYVQPALRYKLLTVEESWVYSSMEATVRAHTHWGGGPAARARLHSPQAPPSAPQAPRIYVQPALRYKLLTVEESWVYSSMEATVRAHTHWGGGPAARARLHSPQAPPSAPQAPRIYVQPALRYKLLTVEESWVYSSMEATVRAHTHWGGGPAARARLHSPQAPPSAPQAPRIYVQPALRYKLLTVEESWVYSSMEATVRAHTHWGGGPAARARLHSPQAPPSAPQAPRIYVQPALRYKLLTVEESWVYSSMEATVRAHTHWGGGPAARARLHSPQAPPSAPQAPRIYVQPALRYKLLTVEESWVYSSMEATVRAHTHWGGGPAARARLHSPQAPPSAPQAPRIYVQPALRYKLLTVEESWVYSSMEATVRAHTHWGGGPAARARLHSPQAPPSAPQAPRIYVQPALRYKLLTVEESWVYSSMEATVRAHTHWGGGPAARARLHSPQAPPSAPQAPRIYVQPALRYKLLTVEESWVYSSMEATVRAHTHWGGGPAARARLHSPQAPPSAPQAPRIYVQPALRYKLLTVEESWVYSSMEATVRAHTHWGGGPAARARLHSPQAPPSAPQAPRIYVQPALSGGPQSAIFRWGSPARANGVIRGYEAQCWVVGADSTSPTKPSACADAHLSPSHTQLMLRDLTPASKYFFQVRAHTDAGFGQYSEVVSTSSDEVNPIPKVMVSSQESIKIIDLDSGESETIPKSTGIPVDFAVSTEENIVYWVNNLEEIFSSRINGSGHFKLTSINGSATSMCVDWVSRSVYWTQLEITSIESYVTYRADLGMPNTRPHITRVFARKLPIYSLQIAPLHQSLFWYEESDTRFPELGTIMTSNLNGSDIRRFFRNPPTGRDCNCPENPQVARPFVIDMTRSKNYDLYWVDPWVHHIIATDMDACKCRIVVDATEKKKYGFTPRSITVDSRYVYWFNSTQKEIFYTTKHHKTRIEERKTAYGYKIMALDPGNQPYPPRLCLFPKVLHLRPRVLAHSANSVTLHMPTVEKPNRCHSLDYEMSTTEYTIFYRVQTKNDTSLCDKESCPYITTTNTEVMINELRPFTNYTVMLEATNYYAKLHEVKPLVGTPMTIQTAAEAPLAPKDVTGMVLSPVLAHVEWKPDPGLSYEVHWRTDDSPSLAHKLKEHNTFEVSQDRSANITRLSPNTAYTVWVRARSRHSAVSADSAPVHLRTYPPPPPIATKEVTPYEIRVLWPPPTSYQLHQYKVEYTEASSQAATWKACTQDERNEWVATELRPLARYRFRLRLQYVANAPPYYWPHDDRFTFETLGDVPGPPGPLRVEGVGDRVLRVWWTEPDTRGSSIIAYRVWGRPQHRIAQGNDNITKNLSELLPANLPSDIDDKMKMRIAREGLELLHNGTETYWLLSGGGGGSGGGGVGAGWVARVQARNAYGWGALSPPAELDAAALAPARPPAAALALALLAALAALLAVAAAVFYAAYNARARKKAAIENLQSSNPARRGPDVELATLRQLPTRHSTNILYNQGVHCPTDAELASLPHIRREQITLTKFLGSGAFGEVFEGVARQINGSTADTKVAVKTLRKSATEQEKTEFLKEAALMSNFKHEHILRLLGVCLDNDPNYIIMELMEGGDLLSYLRAKRVSLYTPESLTLLDLLNMCVDVTKGCRYLEEMHFVHRDLACRNCLVAHRANGRVVKIGDFGLARDIYKNDYYRKEGEGLLPVRWMAVECLVDGVFSCQSDVWAWGVLCWEVLSLGQQPYPARTNRQVLSYVRTGGTLDRPPNCPSVFYDLLQKCWSYSAEARPSFRHCLEVVRALRDKTSPNITLTATPTPAPHYLTLLGDDAVDNRTYLLDENDNACLDEDFPEQHMEPSRLLPERTPKYLELMYDSESAPGTICDGYEIPRAPITYMPPFSRHSIVGVAPNRLIKPPLYRTHSLRTHTRPPNATIIPLRNGLVKRASLCEEISAREPRPCSSREQPRVDLDFDKHVFKTPF